MDYDGIYGRLIERARGRARHGYMERHHVIPKCMGGTNEKSNLVYLTAKEHFLAHKLLVRIHPEVPGLWTALVLMGRLVDNKSRVFASERAKAAKMRKKFKYSTASRQKMSESAKARGRNSADTEFQVGQTPWNKGLPPEQSHRFGKRHSAQTVERMRRTQQANRSAHSQRMKQWWAERKAATQTLEGTQ